jgi:hypothetical protein
VKDKNYTVDKEFMGKEFLIKDSLKIYNWVMESETRQIGGYNCYKATTIIAASKTDFRNFRPKREEDKKAEDSKEDVKTDVTTTDIKEKKTNFMDEIELPKIQFPSWAQIGTAAHYRKYLPNLENNIKRTPIELSTIDITSLISFGISLISGQIFANNFMSICGKDNKFKADLDIPSCDK